VAAGQNLKGHKLLRAQVHLIKFLRRIRDKIKESEGHAPQKDAYAPGTAVHVDTALLKALVRAEPENVLAFLQRPNRCDLEIGIKLLTEYEMLHELMELFKSCNEHRRALELLQVCAMRDEGCVCVRKREREREREGERGAREREREREM
jgi:hypothetical protein